MQPDSTELLAQLRAAFPAEPIRSTGAFSDFGGTYLDGGAFAQHLEGKTWLELDPKYMVMRADALGFLGTQHVVAVLPVYLRALVEEGVWSASADTLVLLLTRPTAAKKLARFDALVAALTPAQRSVIARVLHAFAAADADGSPGVRARAALDSQWKTDLPHDA